MFIPRQIEQAFRRLSDQFPIVSLTGPRQSGKSTFLRNALPDYIYVSLEDPDSMEFATSDPRGFFKQYSNRVIIDEAQRVPMLFSYLQGIVDSRQDKAQYVLSGSQNFLLLETITQSLAGRVGILYLLPLSIHELKNVNVCIWGKIPRL